MILPVRATNMVDLFVLAILFALAFLAAFQESLTMLSFGLLGAIIGNSAHELLSAHYPWWTNEYGLALTLVLLTTGLWGVGHRSEPTSLVGVFIASIGVAGLLAVILLPLLVSIFPEISLSSYASKIFLGSRQELLWTLGAFVSIIIAS